MNSMRRTGNVSSLKRAPQLARAVALRNVNRKMVGTGAAPPAMQLVGPVPVPLSLLVRVIVAGALGVAVLQISINGQPYSAPQLALASVPIGAANLVLAAGPYLGDEAYSLQVLA